MGKVELTIHADVKSAIDGTAQLDANVKKLSTDTEAYNQKSTVGYDNTANSVKQLNAEIKAQEKIVKDLEKAVEIMSKQRGKAAEENSKTYKRLTGDLAIAKQELKGLKDQQEQLNASTTKSEGLFKKYGAVIARVFSTVAIMAFTKASVNAYLEQIRAEAKLETALKGRGKVSESLIKQAKELQSITRFDDEEIINAQALLAINVKDEQQLKKLIPLVMDLAAAKGVDLATAALAVNRATVGNVRGLKDLGIEMKYTGDQTSMLSALQVELADKVGGQAQAALTDQERQLRKMQVAMKELRESWGDFVLSLGNQGQLKGAAEVLDAVRIGWENLGKVRGWEGFSEFLGMLTLGPLLNTQHYKDIADEWERIAKGADAWAKALKDAKGNMPNFVTPGAGGAYPDPYKGMVESLDSLKAKLEELKKEQSAAPLADYTSFDADIEALQKRIAFYEKKDEKAKESSKTNKTLSELEFEINSQRVDNEIATDIYLTEQREKNDEELRQMKEDRLDWEIAQDAALYDAELKALKDFNEEVKKELLKQEKFAKDHPFWAGLGFTNEEQLDQMKDYADEMLSFINEIVDQSVEASERLVDDWNQRIDEQQQLVEREQEDKAEGLANNYELEKENLANMQKARDEAIKDREKNIQIQRTLSTIESGIALVTAAANIMKGFSEIPIVGVILGLLAVGAMITGFIVAQGQISDATKMEHGGEARHGLLKGKRHTQGGIPINAEEGEYFTNRQSTQKYLPLLEAINKDDREGMKLFFDRKFLNKMPSQQFNFDIDKSKKLGEIVREMKKGRADITYGNGFIIERIGGYTKKINLN